jgi:hypothetical protein
MDEADDTDEENLSLSISETENEAGEDDERTMSLTSETAGEDADQSQSALPATLHEGSGKRIAVLIHQNGIDERLLDAMARFCVFLYTQPCDGMSTFTVMTDFAGGLGISLDGTTLGRPSNSPQRSYVLRDHVFLKQCCLRSV